MNSIHAYDVDVEVFCEGFDDDALAIRQKEECC